MKFKLLFVLTNIMITNAALGYCFTVENYSKNEITEAWVDLYSFSGCDGLDLTSNNNWKKCAGSEHYGNCKNAPLKSPNLKIKGNEVKFNLGSFTAGDITLKVFKDYVEITTSTGKNFKFDLNGNRK